MKLSFTFNDPISKKRITRSFYAHISSTELVKTLMTECSLGGLVILPVDVVVDYDDDSSETTTIFVSTLCEKHNRHINKFTKPTVDMTVIENKPKVTNVKKSFINKIKSLFTKGNDERY